MSQMSFSDFEYAGKRKQTRRERFLAEMEQVVPWSGLVALIEPHYPKAGGGRKPYPLETMLRIHLLQNWFSLSDPAMEEALYEITSMRQFARAFDARNLAANLFCACHLTPIGLAGGSLAAPAAAY
ncbi:transposase, partial [Pseudomonas aeruginosa]|uniref:transposase n=1 Tax=Pseudomonas aeruginosa TaxID=287 RepID=UPI001EE25DAA